MKMLSILHWIYITYMMTVLIKSVSLASIPDSNDLISSEEELKPDCPEISFKVTKESSSDDYETTELCKSFKKQINTNDLARERGHDVEISNKFSQLIEVNVCENIGLPCSHIYPFKKTICRQKYMKFQLKIIKKDKTSIVEDFDIPSVCECAFLYSRMNAFGSLKQIS